MDVLVLGGGYAGLLVTRKLERRLPADVSLTLVDDTGDHLVQHELHRAVRNPSYVDAISIPLSELCDRATVRVATVEAVDRERRTVELADGDAVDYDYCAVCIGAETATYDIPGVEEHGTPLKRLDHAATIRREFQAVADGLVTATAEAPGEGTSPATDGTARVVVGGAGLSGVQVAGELAAMAEERGVADAVEVCLLEQEPAVAPNFPESFQRATREQLERAGVSVRTGATVTRADESAIELAGGESLAYEQFVWTGGIRGASALDGERPTVRADLRLDDHTFALGDAARVVDADGEPVPASAAAAVRASEVAAANVVAAVRAERDGGFADFEQWDWESPGWLVSVGDGAVAQLGPTVFTGPVANAIKSAVGVTYLAEHGSLRRALDVLREELDGSTEFQQVIEEHH